MSKKIKIAIDGFSSCGKSTLAKALALQFDFTYIDSGAMYRAVTLYSINKDVFKSENPQFLEIIDSINDLNITFEKDSNNNYYTILNGVNVENKIRDLSVSSKVSIVSALPQVRKRLVELQRNMSNNLSVVMDGRDIGTVVFPDAEIKLFITASSQVRAKRRYDELIIKNQSIDFEEVLKNIQERDFLDQNRADSPLKMADDAILIDNSSLTREQQLNIAIDIVKKYLDENRN